MRALVGEAGGHVVVPPWETTKGGADSDDARDCLERVMAWEPSDSAGYRSRGAIARRDGTRYEHGESADMAAVPSRFENARETRKDWFHEGDGDVGAF